ncbi:hypothetical protein FKM82_015173 [Ascaphus truei]
MVIPNASLTGNCRRLKLKGMSVGMSGMRGMKTSSPVAFPVNIVASMRLDMKDLMQSLVPLQRLGVLRLRSSMMGDPSLSRRRCVGIPGGSSELRNSVG